MIPLLRALVRFGVLGLLVAMPLLRAAEWQWSVPMGNGRAFLWIPPTCERVRGVVMAQNNMIEPGILEHPRFRQTLAELGFAEVFIAPPFDNVFRFDQGAGERFDAMMRALADVSGYDEVAWAPVVPMGHSACASFPWNFAAWNPARTLAILSVKGDAPQTDLTGSGKPNPEWGSRTIDGIPGLMVMSEYEWWDARLTPALRFRAAHPKAPIALWADVGHGHFDATDSLIDFLALFRRKAADARLPVTAGVAAGASSTIALRPVDPAQGWLIDRWRGEQPPRAAAAPAADYRGDRTEAFWCFDAEMANATERSYARSRGKRIQQVDFRRGDRFAPISTTHAGVELSAEIAADGVTFQLGAGFIVPLPPKPPVAAKDKAPPPRVITPLAAISGSHAPGPVQIVPIAGPVVQSGPGTYRVHLNRYGPTTHGRARDIWMLAIHPGDAEFKPTVQQALIHIPVRDSGAEQRLQFAPISNQHVGKGEVRLDASSDAGLPVGFYVREGPAEVVEGRVRFTAIPPRAKWPIRVSVVAFQTGHDSSPSVREADAVERTFMIEP
jgi:hypothetical protein